MRARGLGPVQVAAGGTWVVPAGRLQRTLFGILLARAGRTVPSDHLVTALWGEMRDEQAPARLQVHVHRLRRLAGEGLITTEDVGYRLALDPDDVDWQVFDRQADAVLAGDPGDAERLDRARQALALWRGPAFEGIDDPVCVREADRLEERRLAVTEVALAEEVTRGRHDAVVAELAALAAEHPLRESLQALLMGALHQGGRQGEALEVFRRTRGHLVEELGVDPSPMLVDVHDRVLAGEVLAAAPETPPVVPGQLPAPPARLDGREGALAALDEVLGEHAGSRVVVVCGTAGVGKSALALAWGHRSAADFPDGQLFADLRGFSPGSPASVDAVLDGFLRALGADPAGLRGTEERSAQLRSLVAGRRMLLLLDNARSAEQVRPLLPGSPTTRVLVTSRQSLAGLAVRDGAERLGLAPLAAADAEALLSGLLTERPDAQRLRWLAGRCSHLPLALQVAAERVNADPASVWATLEEGGGTFDVLDAGEDPGSDAREVLSWSYRALSPGAGAVFRALGVLPGAPLDVEALAALAGMSPGEVRTAAAETVRAHLVDLVDGRHRLHDLVAEYAAERVAAEEPSHVRDRMLERLVAHHERRARAAVESLEAEGAGEGFSTSGDALAWLALNVPVVVRAAEQAPPGALADLVALVQHLRRHLNLGGERSAAHRLYAAVGEAVAEGGGPADAAVVEVALGELLYRGGRLEEGAQHFREALRLSELSGDLVRRAWATNSLGVVQAGSGHLRDAEATFGRSRDSYLRAGEDELAMVPERNRAWVLVELAERGHGEPSLGESEDLVAELLDRAAAHVPPRRDPFSLQILALTRLLRDDPAGALDAAGRSRRFCQDMGDLVDEGESLVILGRAHLARGDAAAAAGSFHAAEDLGRRTGQGELLVKARLGCAGLVAAEDARAAVEQFEEVGALARRLGLGLHEAQACAGEAAAREAAGLGDAARPRRRARTLLHERGLPTDHLVGAAG